MRTCAIHSAFSPWVRLGILLLLVAPFLQAQPVFNAPRDYLVGASPQAVVVADFNGDGRPDIATANSTSNNISILLQNGDGTFQAAVNYPVGNRPLSLQIGDVNGDGKPDLLVVNATDNTIGVLLGNGDGTFQTEKTTTISATACCLAVGDFNGDGKADVAVAEPLPQVGTYGAAVMLSNGDGTFQPQVTTAVAGANFSFPLVIADFNQDGNLDVGVGTLDRSANSRGLDPFLGNGDGTFQIEVLSQTVQPLAADGLNGDGKPDLLTTGSNNQGFETLLNWRRNIFGGLLFGGQRRDAGSIGSDRRPET